MSGVGEDLCKVINNNLLQWINCFVLKKGCCTGVLVDSNEYLRIRCVDMMQCKQQLGLITNIPMYWDAKPRLLQEIESRRPRSLEMVKYPRNENKIPPRFERQETAEKQLALVVHRLKKSKRHHKRKKLIKNSKNAVADTTVRPLTWGPNGAKFVEFWDFLDDSLNAEYDLDAVEKPNEEYASELTAKSESVKRCDLNNDKVHPIESVVLSEESNTPDRQAVQTNHPPSQQDHEIAACLLTDLVEQVSRMDGTLQNCRLSPHNFNLLCPPDSEFHQDKTEVLDMTPHAIQKDCCDLENDNLRLSLEHMESWSKTNLKHASGDNGDFIFPGDSLNLKSNACETNLLDAVFPEYAAKHNNSNEDATTHYTTATLRQVENLLQDLITSVVKKITDEIPTNSSGDYAEMTSFPIALEDTTLKIQPPSNQAESNQAEKVINKKQCFVPSDCDVTDVDCEVQLVEAALNEETMENSFVEVASLPRSNFNKKFGSSEDKSGKLKLVRPSSLLHSNWDNKKTENSTLSLLRTLPTDALTPTAHPSDADVFSEETELALEGASFQRQDSFVLRRRPAIAPHPDVDENNDEDGSGDLQGTPTNSFAMVEGDTTWLKCRSLPTNLEPDFTGFNHEYDMDAESEDFSSLSSSQENFFLPTNNRDSTISRVSAASSGTVIASEEEDFPLTSVSSDPLLPSPAKNQIFRSRSFDPHSRNEVVMLASTDISRKTAGGAMRSPVGSAISAPAITIATDNTDDNDNYRIIDDPRFLSPDGAISTSSILYKSAFHSVNDCDVDSCASSSAPSSPPNSPQPRTKTAFKGLQVKEAKTAERQAAEACKWLRAAGFPQYAHIYEVGNFPVDVSGVSDDHDFLTSDQIAALVRRLNVLNKCANMKLDKPPVKDLQTDDDDEDYEQCAISDLWHFEEDGRRWSRLDSKGGEIVRKSSNVSGKHLPHLDEEDVGDVFASEDRLSSTGSEEIQRPIIDGATKHTKLPVKAKSNSFLRRVDLRKFRPSSFRRHQRTASSDDKSSGKFRSAADGRVKSIRKGGIVISDPILKSGQEKIDNMRCLPIENPSINGVADIQGKNRGRKNSSQSLVSSSSSSGSGAASTASTPAPRLRSFTEDVVIRSESVDVRPSSPLTFTRSETSKPRSHTNLHPDSTVFVMPKDHVPGKFPSTIRELGSEEEVDAESGDRTNQRPVSIYDNLPESVLSGAASAQDLMNILDPTAPSVDDSGVFVGGSQESLEVGNPVNADAAFWSVDDIVERTHSLQQMVQSWEGEDNKEQRDEVSKQVLSSYSSENVSSPDDDASNPFNGNKVMLRQARLRWQSFNRDHGPGSLSQQALQLHNLSVGQLMILRRLSMLKLTALLESYAFNTTKGSLSWSVPRFIRRKVPEYKDKAVFGVPLIHNVKRFGQPLPQCIQHAFAFLRRTALDQVGLFRKPGVRSRIQRLRTNCEKNPHLSNFEECSAYDVADMMKQFFRELPDPLMTMKLSETFIGIFLYVPKELWLQTLQAAVMLLPDETRETLKTLLCFLCDVSSRSDENHMNETNLATCFAPSLFYQQFGGFKSSSSSPKVRKQQGVKGSGSLPHGRPDMKEMNENAASNNCLAFMIRHVRELFMISEDAMTQCRMSVMQQSEDVLADEIGYTREMGDEVDYFTDFHSYVDRAVAQTIREEQRIGQNKGSWQNVPSVQGCELMYKKMNDDNPLRMWRCQVEVEGVNPKQIADRILNERHLWDDDLLQWKILQQPDEKTQLFQIVRAEMSPHPTRDYCLLRSLRENTSQRGTCVIVEASTSQSHLLGDVRGVVLTSRYVIEPTENPSSCTVTHISRVDTKGRNPEWYNKAYGHIECQLLLRLRDSVRVAPPKRLFT